VSAHGTFRLPPPTNEPVLSYAPGSPERAAIQARVKEMESERIDHEAMAKGELPMVTWEKIIEHIDHAVKVAGADHVGLRSDFDGATMPFGLTALAFAYTSASRPSASDSPTILIRAIGRILRPPRWLTTLSSA